MDGTWINLWSLGPQSDNPPIVYNLEEHKKLMEEGNSVSNLLEEPARSHVTLSRNKRQVCHTQTCDQVTIHLWNFKL